MLACNLLLPGDFFYLGVPPAPPGHFTRPGGCAPQGRGRGQAVRYYGAALNFILRLGKLLRRPHTAPILHAGAPKRSCRCGAA